MTSPLFLRTNSKRRRQADNLTQSYHSRSGFPSRIEQEDDEDESMASDAESHMTPASLPQTRYQLFSGQISVMSKDNTEALKYQSTSSMKRALKLSNFDSSPSIPKQDLLNSSIEEKSDQVEDKAKETENEVRTDLISINFLNPTTENTSYLKSRQNTSAQPLINPHKGRAKRGNSNQKSAMLALGQIQKTDPNESIIGKPSKRERRLGVFTPRGVTNEQIYFLDNKLASGLPKMENKKLEQRPTQSKKKFVKVIANAVKKSNAPVARVLFEAIKKANPKALEDPKKKKKSVPSLIKRVREVVNQMIKAISELVLEPDSTFILFWRALTVIITLIDIFYMPFLLSFYYPETGTDIPFLDDTIFSFFFTSFILKFDTAYYSRGALIRDRKKIAKHYLRGGFCIELVTIIVSVPRVILRNYIMINWEVIRILRIVFVTGCLTKLEDHMRLSVVWSNMVRLVKLWFSMLIVTNFIACVVHAIGDTESSSQHSWLDVYGLRNEPMYRRYVVSAYWSVTTTLTIGYGDVTPQTDNEKIFAMFIMMIASAMFGYTMNTINIIVEEIDEYKMVKKKKMRRANNYMKMKGLNPDMQVRIRKYLEHTLEEEHNKRNIENDVIGMLHGNLKREVLVEVYGKTLRDCLLFKENNFTKKFLADASHALKEMFLSPEQEIFSEKESLDESMYFLANGKVQVYLKECDKVIKTLHRNSYFGEIAFFTGKPRSASAKSLNFSEVFCLQKDKFMDVIRYNGVDKEQFHYLKDMVNLYSRYDMLKIRCYFCDEVGHIINECHQLQLVVNKMGVIQQHIRDQARFRKTYQRRRVKKLKYTIDQLTTGYAKFHKMLDYGQAESIRSHSSITTMSIPHLYKEDSFKNQVYTRQKKRMGTLEEQMEDGAGGEAGSPAPPPNESLQFMLAHMYLTKKLSYHQPGKNNLYDPYFTTWNFERVANYELYFPHNNIQKMISTFEEKRIEATILGLRKKGKNSDADTFDSPEKSGKLFKKGLNVIGVYKNVPMINSRAQIKKARKTEESASPTASLLNFSPYSPLNRDKNNPPKSVGFFQNAISQSGVDDRLKMFASKQTVTEFPSNVKNAFESGVYPNLKEEQSSPSIMDLNPVANKNTTQHNKRQSNLSPNLIVTKIGSQGELSLSNKLSPSLYRDRNNASVVVNSVIENNPTLEDQDAELMTTGRNEIIATLGRIDAFKFEVNSPSKNSRSSQQRISRAPAANLRLQIDSQRIRHEIERASVSPPLIPERARSESPIDLVRRSRKNTKMSYEEQSSRGIKIHIDSLVGKFGAQKVMEILAELEGNNPISGETR